MLKRMNIRISGLGGQGAVTAAHILAMAANKDGKFSISNPFFGAEKRMAPAESYVRIGMEKIYDRGELVYPDVIMVFHPQVITQQKSYTAPFYSGVTRVVSMESLDVALQERFGKRYVASGGTATLDEAIKKKYAKKEMLLKKNMETIVKSYELAVAWSEETQPAMAGVGA